MANRAAACVSSVVLGQVRKTNPLTKRVNVWVYHLVLDKWLMHHFPERTPIVAHDEHNTAKEGDIVLLKKLPTKRSLHVTHDVDRIIYAAGNVIDPITGKRCDGESYWDLAERTKLLSKDPVEREIALTETLREKKAVYHEQCKSEPLMSLNKKEWDDKDKKPAFSDPPKPVDIENLTYKK